MDGEKGRVTRDFELDWETERRILDSVEGHANEPVVLIASLFLFSCAHQYKSEHEHYRTRLLLCTEGGTAVAHERERKLAFSNCVGRLVEKAKSVGALKSSCNAIALAAHLYEMHSAIMLDACMQNASMVEAKMRLKSRLADVLTPHLETYGPLNPYRH
jgi:hypothetical protein